jgi:hypothetical protein
MTVQTTYTTNQILKLEGIIADQAPKRIDNYIAGAAIPYGRGVIQGASDGAVLLAAASGVPVGFALRPGAGNDGSANSYVAGEPVAVVAQGNVYAMTAANATKNAPAYLVTAVGADQGKVTPTSTDNLGPIGEFLEGGAAGTLLKVAIGPTI